MRLDQALAELEKYKRLLDAESQVSWMRGEEVDHLKALVDQLADASHALAMMGLQSNRYASDPDYRDAVDDALAAVKNSGWKP